MRYPARANIGKLALPQNEVWKYAKAHEEVTLGRARRWKWLSPGPFAAPLSIMTFAISLVACVSVPPAFPIGDANLSNKAQCMTVARKADYTTMRLAIGTPLRRLTVLVDLQTIASPGTTALHLWSDRLIGSQSIVCAENGTCEDVVLATESGPDGDRKRFVANFSYSSAHAVNNLASSLGLDGVLVLETQTTHTLLPSHICLEDNTVARRLQKSNVTLDYSLGVPFTTATTLRRAEPSLSRSPASTCADDAPVQLFPNSAVYESNWLSASSRDYEEGHNSVEQRRVAIETANCGANTTTAQQQLRKMLAFNCAASGTCRTTASVPFRRLADSIVQIQVLNSTYAVMQTQRVAVLQWLPRLVDRDDDVAGGILRVVLLSLTALVIFVRSATSPSAYVLFDKCCITLAEHFAPPGKQKDVDISKRKKDRCAEALERMMRASFGYNTFVYRLLLAFYPDDRRDIGTSLQDTLESCLLGVLAAFVRLMTTTIQFVILTDDGNARVAVSEVAASSLSIMMWTLRWFGADSSHNRIFLFGGSTAITDAAAAVVVGFMEPPLRANLNTFASIARLLTSVVIVFTSLVRVCYATACCWTLADGISTHTLIPHGHGLERYAPTLYAVGFMWLLQAAALGVLVADAFVTPTVDSFSWAREGPLWPARAVAALFFASLMLPKLNYSSIIIANRRKSD